MSRPRARLTGSFPRKRVILYHLLTEGTLRFSDLRRRIPSVTQRMLTKQ